MASAPAFVQRKAQLLPEALEYLFHQFTEVSTKEHLYKGYRLLATDSSDLQIFADPKDADSYYPGTNGQMYDFTFCFVGDNVHVFILRLIF